MILVWFLQQGLHFTHVYNEPIGQVSDATTDIFLYDVLFYANNILSIYFYLPSVDMYDVQVCLYRTLVHPKVMKNLNNVNHEKIA